MAGPVVAFGRWSAVVCGASAVGMVGIDTDMSVVCEEGVSRRC